jgi:hypothetical protein
VRSLLRVYHAEALGSVIGEPMAAVFLRTSYVTTPSAWQELARDVLANRVEQLLNAAYARRNWSMAQSDDPTPMLPFLFDFEWVGRAPSPPLDDDDSERGPLILPGAGAHAAVIEGAIDELLRILDAERPGIDARCYDRAFEVFRIDDDDSWHLIRHEDRSALFTGLFGTQA